jgi:hypothetical protein
MFSKNLVDKSNTNSISKNDLCPAIEGFTFQYRAAKTFEKRE